MPIPDAPARSGGPTIAVFGALKLALHLWTSSGYGIFRDELYYRACSDHLAWGYVDHPPLVAFIARAARMLFGDSLSDLRAPAAFAGAGGVVLAGLLARELGGEIFAQGLACLCVALAPVGLSLSHVYSMNAFEPVFWTAGALLLVKLARGASNKLWLWLGVILGLGLLNKHSMLFFGTGAAVAVLATPLRRTLRTPWPWLALAIAGLLISPNVLWEIHNAWPTLEFLQNAQTSKNVALGPLIFLREVALQQGPLAMPIWIVGFGYALFAKGAGRARILGWIFVVVFGILLAQHGKPYYLAPAFPLVFAPGAVVIEGWLASKALRWPRLVILAAVATGGASLLPMAIPVLPEATYMRYARAIHAESVPEEKHERGSLPQFFADMHGWKGMVDVVAEVYRTLPPDDRRVAGILARNYGEAGAVDYFGAPAGLPKAISGHNNYYLWGPGDVTGEVVVAIGGKKEDLTRFFDDVQDAAVWSNTLVMPYENHLVIWVCRKPHAKLSEMWPEMKAYT